MPTFLVPMLLSIATNPSVDASVAQLLTGLFAHIASSNKLDANTQALVTDLKNAVPDMVKAVVSNTVASTHTSPISVPVLK